MWECTYTGSKFLKVRLYRVRMRELRSYILFCFTKSLVFNKEHVDMLRIKEFGMQNYMYTFMHIYILYFNAHF